MRAGLCGLLTIVLAAAAFAPDAAEGMCCVCRNCTGAAFCVDGLQTSQTCTGFCLSVGCTATTYDGADACAGGCDSAPVAPTATPPSTATATLTRTATLTATATATFTATATATATATPTTTDTVTHTPTDTPTHTPVDTTTPSATATITATATESATPADTATTTETATPSETPTITSTPEDTATPSATATITQTPTITPTPALGGVVRYYSSDDPVPGVNVSLLGGMPESTTTDANGHYGFADAGSGMLSIQPSKDGDFGDAITSLDASFILQAIAQLRTLSPDQLLAGDVTGDGTISTLDASLILQFQVQLISEFPAAAPAVCDSDWLFRPSPVAAPNQTLVQPVLSGGVCQQGEIVFDPFSPPQGGQNFTAILLGDVTGNWTP
ncbi:MAG: dockerin type I domain-containing protein [Deltaproteobacteria bacterium]|nr:dockerin type I domain-containing protein [Deltaproteobacteria bacterium]